MNRSFTCLARVVVPFLLLLPPLAHAQDASKNEEEGPPTTLSVAMKQDIFFGFHGISQVGVGLSDTLDATFYAILWTRTGFGAGGSGGNLWTEWGGGVNFKLLDGNLTVNPQLGVLNGTLLSGSSRGLVFEGIVPNITVTYGDGLLEGQIYAGFYLGLRELNGSSQNDFLHYWAYFGIAPIRWLSFGVHWEHLIQARGATENPDDVYMWIGPYIEARGGGGFIRFSGGADLAPEGDIADFYQVTVGMSF